MHDNVTPYSPSQTKLYLECPYKWYLQYHSNMSGGRESTVAQMAGSLYGKVMEYWYHNRDEKDLQSYTKTTHNVMSQEAAGVGLDEAMLNRIIKLVKATMQNSDAQELIGQAIGAEVNVGRGFYNAYIDLLGEDWILDWKLKTQLRPPRALDVAKQLQRDWQIMHYLWEINQRVEEPVETFYLGIGYLHPTPKSVIHPLFVPLDDVKKWAVSAESVWRKMREAGQALKDGVDPLVATPMSNNHNLYGGCPMLEYCFHL